MEMEEVRKCTPSVIQELIWDGIRTKIEEAVSTWGAIYRVYIHGSYGLGVHGADSDLDFIIVVPKHLDLMIDFFENFVNIVRISVDPTEIKCIPTARIPLLKLVVENVSVDIGICRVQTVLEDILQLHAVDESSSLLLSSLITNITLHSYVPHTNIGQVYVDLVRYLKIWAKKRHIYGNVIGYLSGVHIATMGAYVYKIRQGSLPELLVLFFNTFSRWEWPLPLILSETSNLPPVPKTLLMPIAQPGSNKYIHSNMKSGTCSRIQYELQRGFNILENLKPISDLLQPPNLGYPKFLKIWIWGDDDWMGFVKSQFPYLINELESEEFICDPSLDHHGRSPVSFFWGVISDMSKAPIMPMMEDRFRRHLKKKFKGACGDVRLAVIGSKVFIQQTTIGTRV